ncbi:MAG: TldD/PmbA family protein [Bryobacteraceae bacterium]|nr:TldD/PmbA family protein [Bryobacteraceae bacterium]MCX7602919.1 TldD/PmbA family protein [Bryobacteraceae bacterium]
MRILAVAGAAVAALGLLLSVDLAAQAVPSAAEPALVRILAGELDRNYSALREKADPAPYFLCYRVTEADSGLISASLGAVVQSNRSRRRVLDVSVRVGTPKMDNFHLLKGERPRFTASAPLPVEDVPAALARIAWRETDRAWRAAAQRLMQVQSAVKMQTSDPEVSDLPDFSDEEPQVSFRPVAEYRFPADAWNARLKKISAVFSEFPSVIASSVSLQWQREIRTFLSTEGARIQHGRNYFHLEISARAKGYDGNDVNSYELFDAEDPSRLPSDEVLEKAARRIGAQLTALLRAPAAEPYVGPAILSGRAAGVFFHEIFGHRIEGHRQRDETEGQTFSKSVGKPVLPEFLSVYSDPSLRRAAGADLNGWYEFDDEGVPARRVVLVENGILRAFLMSRLPVPGFLRSNGHGRAQPGLEPVSRQANLIVESARQVPSEELRNRLRAEIRRQNKPYGLYFEQVAGGFTSTRRAGVQAFTVIPLIVYRVYADGRPDELIRGADIVGTPLASFSRILATSNQPEVFNGYCGAESGSVPVSVVTPALLVSEIEIQRKPESKDVPPILPRPSMEARQ